MRTTPSVIFSTLLLAAAMPALAQMYKWVDDNGVVNYGDKPPPRSEARPFAEGAGSVSVVPGIGKEALERARERDQQRRLRQLEDEVAELRARELARDNAPPQVVYQEVYVPAYGYGYRRPPPSRPPWSGRPGHRPDEPGHRPNPPARPRQLPSAPNVFTQK